MIRTFTISLLLCFGLSAQTTCTFSNVNTATGRTTYQNSNNACNVWVLTYQTTGISAQSVQIETSDDNVTYTLVSRTPLVGSNPSTTNTDLIQLYAYGAWVAVNVTTFTGSGTLSFQMHGSAGVSANTKTGGGGGGGSPTGPAGGVLGGTYPNPSFASTQGNGSKTQLSTGTTTTNDCVKFDANGNTIDAGAGCGVPSGSAGGDLSGTYPNPTVAKVNAVAYPSGPSTHQSPVVTASNTVTYKTIPNCTDTGGQHLNYTQSTDTYSCGTTGGGGGGSSASPVRQSWSQSNFSLPASPIAVLSGDTVLVFVCSDTNPTGISDGTNTYTEVVSHSNGSYFASMWSTTTGATAALTITVSAGATAHCGSAMAMEMSKGRTLDATNSSTGYPSVASITTAAANELIITYSAFDVFFGTITISDLAPGVIGAIQTNSGTEAYSYFTAGSAGTYLGAIGENSGVSFNQSTIVASFN